MKLLDILGRELESWRTWAAAYTQDANRKIYPCTGLDVKFNGTAWTSAGLYPMQEYWESDHLATDHATAIVTREMWQAERDKIQREAVELAARQERDKLVKPKASADGWVRHRGRKCPVPAGTRVSTRHRDGKIVEVHHHTADPKASDVSLREVWSHRGDEFDIMAFRIHKPSDQPAPDDHEPITATLESTSGPLEWRDRIYELDTLRAELNAAYDQQSLEITQERAGLVDKLKGEGLALVEKGVKPVDDMSDPENWRKGDFVECVKETSSEDITVGKVYELTYVTSDSIGFLDDDGDHRDRADLDKFKWHSRPGK